MGSEILRAKALRMTAKYFPRKLNPGSSIIHKKAAMSKLKIIIPLFILGLTIGGLLLVTRYIPQQTSYGAPPYFAEVEEQSAPDYGRFGDLSKWTRPEGPLRVGLQVGHWKNHELPDELRRLRESGGGTSGSGVMEWEVNLKIAEEAKKLLITEGIEVDILPATIPPGYFADAVIAIHADGSTNPLTSGFKAATPRRDLSGKAGELLKILEEEYQKTTGLMLDPNITRNMTGYYAFSWRRYEYSTHPMAPAVILETGFLTNPTEAQMLINHPELPAQAIKDALIRFLQVSSEERT
jgi:hypothetical protein